MPPFTYKAKDPKGQLINGTLDAESRAAVTNRLQAMGYFPIDIQGGEKKNEGAFSAFSLGKRHVKADDLTSFYRQMSDLIGAGVPLVKSLGIVKSQTEHPIFHSILGQVNSDVQSGETFARALEKHPAVFSKLTVALVHAGETGGLLDQTLARIAEYAEKQDELKSKIIGALAYPAIMVLVGIGAVLVILVYVMPRVLGIFEELDQTLPMITQMLLVITDFIQHYGLFVLAGMAVAGALFWKYIQTDVGRMNYHIFLLRIPKFGTLLSKREIGAFTRTLGSLLLNGVPILEAIKISGEVMSILPIKRQIEKIPESITQGAGVAPALRESPYFPPIVVNMVTVGEETGDLPNVLTRIANAYETQVDRELKLLTSLLEPIIILVLGLIVMVLVIAMILPIFSIDPSGAG